MILHSSLLSQVLHLPYILIIRAQWLKGRAPASWLQEPGFESYAAVLKSWASFSTLHCSSSLSCINEYLAIYSGGCVRSALIVAYGWIFPTEVLSTLNCPEDWILRYIRMCLYFFYFNHALLYIFFWPSCVLLPVTSALSLSLCQWQCTQPLHTDWYNTHFHHSSFHQLFLQLSLKLLCDANNSNFLFEVLAWSTQPKDKMISRLSYDLCRLNMSVMQTFGLCNHMLLSGVYVYR